MSSSRWKVCTAMLGLCLPLMLMGCSSTAVSPSSTFQANEGLVALRLIDLGKVPIKRFTVESEQSGEEYTLQAIRFGQQSGMTYVGRLPAGRYRPKELMGSNPGVNLVRVPLTQWTGAFDIEAGRVTQLGTMIFTPGLTVGYDTDSRTSRSLFLLPLDPTPVPVGPLLAARFPQLAGTASAKAPLGWVAGSTPTLAAVPLDRVRANVNAVGRPMFTEGNTMASGGLLGVIAVHRAGKLVMKPAADTVHTITAVLALQDRRWLAGGEEGYLALSTNQGQSWKALPALPADDLVLHLVQRPDGRLLAVTDRDSEALVYESADHPIAWKEIKRIPSDRERSFMNTELGESAEFLPDFAAHSNDRLVVYTRPRTLSSLDLRTGLWETQTTPAVFHAGMKVTPDGYVLGFGGLYGSENYGQSWKKLESWVTTSEPHFMDRRRGVVLATELSFSGTPSKYRLRTTSDGGATWMAGEEINAPFMATIPSTRRDKHGRLLRPLWGDPSGRWWYTTDGSDRLLISTDGGRNWN
jgi:hypothetical protein